MDVWGLRRRGKNRARLLTSSFSKYSMKLTFTNKIKCFYSFIYISVLCNIFTFVALTPGNEIKAEGSSFMRSTSSHVSFCTYAVSIRTNCYQSCSSASVIPVTKMEIKTHWFYHCNAPSEGLLQDKLYVFLC